MTRVAAGQWPLAAIALVAGLAACSGEQGVLTVSLDPYPKITNAATVPITGVVTRMPVKASRIIVNATAGTTTKVDTADGTGHFGVTIPLTANGSTQISLSAADETGATSEAVAITIQQDNQAPTITQSTPADVADNVPLNTSSVQLILSEKVIFSTAGGFRFTRQGVPVPGSLSVSADSLTFTFTPSGALSPNAIYGVGFTGGADAAGNALTSSRCFITTLTGATRSNTFTDPPATEKYDLFGTSFPASIALPDLVAARFARDGSLFSAIFQFGGVRTFSNTANDRAGVLLDLDVDQDSLTGFITIKDSLLKGSANPPSGYNGFDTLSSGIKAEYLIDLEPDPGHGDSAEVVRYSGYAAGSITGLFVPGVCGTFMGFALPWSAFGSEDGNVNVLAVGINGTSTDLYIDPMPTKGHLALSLAAASPPAPGPYLTAARTGVPYVRRPRVRAPLLPIR
ncbi:MAG: Ig-like domain-containing protein [Gemmatimonadetes bacterium]|nr:Ig-like domain-containing protein [Gemmatimonadota bacterium]